MDKIWVKSKELIYFDLIPSRLEHGVGRDNWRRFRGEFTSEYCLYGAGLNNPNRNNLLTKTERRAATDVQ